MFFGNCRFSALPPPPTLTQCAVHFLKTTKLCLSIQIRTKEISLCRSKHSNLVIHCCGIRLPMCCRMAAHRFAALRRRGFNHKCVCGELNRHFCQTRVIGRFYLSLVHSFPCADIVNTSFRFNSFQGVCVVSYSIL